MTCVPCSCSILSPISCRHAAFLFLSMHAHSRAAFTVHVPFARCTLGNLSMKEKHPVSVLWQQRTFIERRTDWAESTRTLLLADSTSRSSTPRASAMTMQPRSDDAPPQRQTRRASTQVLLRSRMCMLLPCTSDLFEFPLVLCMSIFALFCNFSRFVKCLCWVLKVITVCRVLAGYMSRFRVQHLHARCYVGSLAHRCMILCIELAEITRAFLTASFHKDDEGRVELATSNNEHANSTGVLDVDESDKVQCFERRLCRNLYCRTRPIKGVKRACVCDRVPVRQWRR